MNNGLEFASSTRGEREGSTAMFEAEDGMGSLRPLMEGARARGVADACELLGAGAVLLDRSGAVLHLSTSARGLLGSALRLVEGHLVANSAKDSGRLERLVGETLAGRIKEDGIVIGGSPALRVRIAAMPGALGDDAQLLKAVLFISNADPTNLCEAEKQAQAA